MTSLSTALQLTLGDTIVSRESLEFEVYTLAMSLDSPTMTSLTIPKKELSEEEKDMITSLTHTQTKREAKKEPSKE